MRTFFFRLPNPGFTTRQSQSASSSFARLAQLIRTEANLNNWILSLEPGWPRRVDRYYWYWIEGYVGNWLSTELKSWDIGVEIASDLWSVQHEFESQFSCVDFKQNTQFLHDSVSCDFEKTLCLSSLASCEKGEYKIVRIKWDNECESIL